ncbi:hypothetical protein ACFV4P_02445 [Kitasatospora sp. NPDC059795]|uniref:hypothetical protein n=1 Tax=Kitasatospora sp. NPDC059795 TaxID=3346949 RepID=UPI0036675A4A
MAYQLDAIGPFTLMDPAGALPGTGWRITHGSDWLPGQYASRDAALLAIGLVLDGEHAVRLEEFWDYPRASHAVTVEDIISFVANKGTTS